MSEKRIKLIANEEKQDKGIGNYSLSTPQQDSVSQEEMELLRQV